MKNTKSIKSASRLCDNKHIFPIMLRDFYKVSGPLTSVGLLCFALLMLGIGIRQNQDKLPCFAVAFIFGMLNIGYTMIWIRNYHLMNATYYVNNSVVFNCVDKIGIRISVDLRSAILKEYTQVFYVGKGSFKIDYIIFSNNTRFESILSDTETTGIYKNIRKLWEAGAIIVPKSSWQDTKDSKTGDGLREP